MKSFDFSEDDALVKNTCRITKKTKCRQNVTGEIIPLLLGDLNHHPTNSTFIHTSPPCQVVS